LRNKIVCATIDRVQATVKPAAAEASADPVAVARAVHAANIALGQRLTPDLFQQLAALGLSVTRHKMLLLLQRERRDELSVKALGDHLSLSLAAASRAVEGLHQRGYVERLGCDHDRRVKHVRITDAGRAAIAQLHATHVAVLADVLATLTASERRDLAAALAPLLARLDADPLPGGPSR
jgi:DNA-binding MarR family transcriptional regulator